MYYVDFTENVLFERYALLACHDDRCLGSLSNGNSPLVLDTTANNIIYEPLAKNDDYLK